MRLLRFFIIATLLLTSACVKMTSVRSNPSYDRILKERTAAAFLPSQVEVNTVGVGSKTRMYDYEANLEGVINRDVPPLLRAKGYNLKTYRKADVHAANISHQVLRFRSKYDEQMKKLYPTIAMKEELAFNTQHNFGKEA
ncbi:MAG: hypothetical protein K0R98_1321, partial [Rickettsiaceae bacterium]|nr:hypothetical protein [Rickettsiaceae bacterium]